ncbi:MAG TPA: hypothetical protein VD997_03430 [Phycisphaerales bacterium]|nr:hypothetical protein [Phycisphaerales bacterium]
MKMRVLAGVFVCVLGLPMGAAVAQPCGAVVTFADAVAPTRELHVAVNGSNATGDGTAARPLATIVAAAQRATPGTAIRVHAGTYSGGMFIANLAGTAGAPIWIGGVAGEARPVIQGGGNGIQFSRARYVVVHDLEVRGATGNGLNCDDGGEYSNADASGFLVLRNLFIHDIGSGGNNDGLKLSGIYDFWVVGCEVARCGGAASGSLVDMVGCHRGVIARNFLHEASANALQIKGGTSHIDVLWNRMEECGERAVNIGGSTGLEFFRPPVSQTGVNAEARNIRVVGNVIQGGTCAVAFVGAVDSVVSNNTIVTPHNWILRILQETVTQGGYTFAACGNSVFENNLVYFERADLSTYVNVGANTAPTTFMFRNNLWYAYDNPAASNPNLPVAETNGVRGVNPLLETALPQAGASYKPAANGPAVGAGRGPALVSGDFVSRCYAAEPSIGAYEAARVCGTSDFNGDGDSGTDQDIEAFFACIGGNCCAACWGGGADFNGDGDTGTDQDIEAFFRVLGGLAC